MEGEDESRSSRDDVENGHPCLTARRESPKAGKVHKHSTRPNFDQDMFDATTFEAATPIAVSPPRNSLTSDKDFRTVSKPSVALSSPKSIKSN